MLVRLCLLLLCSTPLAASEQFLHPTHLEHVILHPTEILDAELKPPKKKLSLIRKISKGVTCMGSAAAFGSASVLARIGWGICKITPWTQKASKECLLFSKMCGTSAKHLFSQTFKRSSAFHKIPTSHSSWYRNKIRLSQIPTHSEEDKKLLLFLENRWLAKSTGFYPTLVDWICPCFDVFIQVHPETTNSYARDPWNKCSQTYLKKVENWKHSLPMSDRFPLILTRPEGVVDYLPNYIEVSEGESLSTTVEKLASKIQSRDSKVILDLTLKLEKDVDAKQWYNALREYQSELLNLCKEHQIKPSQVLCIQRLQEMDTGAIRLLNFGKQSKKQINKHYQHLLKWVSKLGLSANRIELDRATPSQKKQKKAYAQLPSPCKAKFLSSLKSFEESFTPMHPQVSFMLNGTLQTLTGCVSSISDEKWKEVISNPTRSGITYLSFLEIQKQLHLVKQEKKEPFFYRAVTHIEEIQAHLTALLEIFSPFTSQDFSSIYRDVLTCIPQELKKLTNYGIHSSGMTSFAGIFKAVETSLGKTPSVIYGENTYFEIIHVAEMISNATSIETATQQELENADLILAQFNPVLKRIDFEVTGYGVEKIAQTLRKSLEARQGKPVTLALDCTLDYIDSIRTAELLTEFAEEIKKGHLNVISYRSGLKFDLFGMDNYCGAPFFMIHNEDPKWKSFDRLLSDPALQTDPLSLNWFCLAYKNASKQLTQYEGQIIKNTRAFLDKIPQRLLTNTTNYRVIPVEKDADPIFVDIKIYGMFHTLRASMLGGFLTLECLKGKHPVFYRPSLGFYHPNFSILFSKKCSTIRLTLGLDPSQVDLLAKSMRIVDKLN